MGGSWDLEGETEIGLKSGASELRVEPLLLI